METCSFKNFITPSLCPKFCRFSPHEKDQNNLCLGKTNKNIILQFYLDSISCYDHEHACARMCVCVCVCVWFQSFWHYNIFLEALLL